VIIQLLVLSIGLKVSYRYGEKEECGGHSPKFGLDLGREVFWAFLLRKWKTLDISVENGKFWTYVLKNGKFWSFLLKKWQYRRG
jgi:hypothetical protein